MEFKRPARSQPERTGREYRRLKFYGLRDNLLVGWDSRTVLILSLNGTTSTTAPLSSAT
jgi:hypothetical protein